jgi:hypothetical protein
MRLLCLATLFACSLAFDRTAAADPQAVRFGPFASASPDSGTCGNTWADDTFERTFRIDPRPTADGTFVVVERFRHGRFVTRAGASPGGCDTNPGGTLAAGVDGRMHGMLVMVVTGILDPYADCTAESCGTTAGFVATVFGPDATFTIPSFRFQYAAGRNGHWTNASEDLGGNRSDITGTPRGSHRDGDLDDHGNDGDGDGDGDGGDPADD